MARAESAAWAHAVEDFMTSSSSQLTFYGLQQLHERLRENELAVMFRNNHFATLLKKDGGLYLLVTDLGYMHEADVVWEKLDMVDGDTEFVDANFKSFRPHTGLTPEVWMGG